MSANSSRGWPEANTDIRIHYEVRPSLSRAQLKQMRHGGLFSIQPGVESLSTHLLKLMRKHTTGMRNLELIKWCTYYGINNLYNILARFPGETLCRTINSRRGSFPRFITGRRRGPSPRRARIADRRCTSNPRRSRSEV